MFANIWRSNSLMNITRRLFNPQTSLANCYHIFRPTMGLTNLNTQLTACPQMNGLQNHELLRTTVPMMNPVCGFKVKGKLKRRCKDCYFVVRQERLYVICKTHPRHKQMAMKASDKKSWILTHATQSAVRPY